LRIGAARIRGKVLNMPNRNALLLLLSLLVIAQTGYPCGNRARDFNAHGIFGSQVNNREPITRNRLSVAANFDVQKIAEGVYAVIRKDLPGLMVDANNVFIINDEDVIVVDANGAPAITRQVLEALRKLTDKPVKYVINTHYHDDHIRGNQVYREAFPNVEFIAHAFALDYLPNQGAVNRKNFLEGAGGFLKDLKGLLAENRSLLGGEMTAEERDSLSSDIQLAELVLSEGAQAQTILPTITVDNRLTLHRGNRIIDIRHFGQGHTGADLVVHLPKEEIVITGDLVVAPIPLVGNPQSNIGGWAFALERLTALQAKIIVPGHGQIMRDDSYIKLLANLFASIKRQTLAAVGRGETLEQARRSINLEEFRKSLTGDSRPRKIAFNMYVAGPAIAAAFREATEKR
jgi:cyclase